MDRDAPVITRQTIKGLGITEDVDEVFEQFSENTPEEVMALANLEDDGPVDVPDIERILPSDLEAIEEIEDAAEDEADGSFEEIFDEAVPVTR